MLNHMKSQVRKFLLANSDLNPQMQISSGYKQAVCMQSAPNCK